MAHCDAEREEEETISSVKDKAIDTVLIWSVNIDSPAERTRGTAG
jgi:hypothetical protein